MRPLYLDRLQGQSSPRLIKRRGHGTSPHRGRQHRQEYWLHTDRLTAASTSNAVRTTTNAAEYLPEADIVACVTDHQSLFSAPGSATTLNPGTYPMNVCRLRS